MNFFEYITVFFYTNYIIVIILFWFLTFVGAFFFKKNDFFLKNDFYECGFKTLSDFNFKLNCGILITMIFVIFYDIELIFTIPFLLNSHFYNYSVYPSVFFIYFSILITFILDIYEDILIWEF